MLFRVCLHLALAAPAATVLHFTPAATPFVSSVAIAALHPPSSQPRLPYQRRPFRFGLDSIGAAPTIAVSDDRLPRSAPAAANEIRQNCMAAFAAVERIVRIEGMRIREIAEVGGKPAHVLRRLDNVVRQRTPIFHWASEQWIACVMGSNDLGAWSPVLRRNGAYIPRPTASGKP